MASSLFTRFEILCGLNDAMVVTSPPNEKRTIGGDAQSVKLVVFGLHGGVGDDCCRRIGICTGDVGRLRLLKRLTSSAERLLWRNMWKSDDNSANENRNQKYGLSTLMNC